MLSVEELVLMILTGIISAAGLRIWQERASIFQDSADSYVAWARLMHTVEDARAEIDAR